ncbi:putative 1-phosphatidylinositol-3-phosphate 5-kinase FAB1D isoform X2 [Impatiens glandulifera]|uniref:putative 1-phosphatidylinositol-3-phosphate 5-kinase FAB1D isoform X2 n=1 Tax=Impatiens glandulifera TaxID=253017 RepID=UPI001FB06E74|nr:putative 1-phosphatidylinositol-3-phosphate 5-kinase FAB1D isoform X2 [Impatiens glandulifera]
MYNLCSSCGAEMEHSNDCKESMETGDVVKLNCKDPVSSCKVCLEKDKRLTMENSSNPEITRLISPTVSLASNDSSLTSSSDISVDAYSCGSSEESRPDRSRDYPNNESYPQGMKIHTHGNGYHGSTMETKGKVKDINDTIGNLDNSDFIDDAHGNVSLQAEMSPIMKDYMNVDIWLPPELEDIENRIEGSTAMDEAMNGKFKIFVGQLLKSVDVDVSGENGESWTDIVTRLSWEAASFVKPDAREGKPMDPDGYVKVKCVATGSRNQSEVIRGLVFKKNVANKHMPTKYANPRLLLISGTLGDSVGLSSFNNIKQEENNHKSIVDMIENCHPNLVLVEKSVSGDIQKSIFDKGMTLVSDMKLDRLKRIELCTDSQILSADMLMNQTLKQCDSFHFEQYVLDHNASGENGKKQVKTLLFIEGCPTRLGCTILLKGAHSDELKKIKCVVQCAVVMAYHLISETAFLLDQRAMFPIIPFNGEGCLPIQSNVSELEDSNVETIDASSTSDIPISNGFHEGDSENLSLELEGDSPFSYVPYNPVVLSGLSSISASLKNVIGNSFPLFSLTSRGSISKYLGINESQDDSQTLDSLQDTASLEEALENGNGNLGKSVSDENKSPESERPGSPFSLDEVHPDTKMHSGINKEQSPKKDEILTALDYESILVLESKRNFKIKIENLCEKSRFSHIKFYRNPDVPLGRFLQYDLLDQKCSTCGETPESHFYYYAHHDKQLTIQVKRLPVDKCLPTGKLWMWSRCGKCKCRNGHLESTKRVLISPAAQGLSFRKFLELSFSNPSILSRSTVCGHSFHKDFLHFFGLGSMAAMLRYSTVATYSVSMPPITLEFNNSIRGEFLKKEVEKVCTKGLNLFGEVAKFLQKIGPRFEHSILNFRGSVKKFSDIEQMLKMERSQFEANIDNVLMNNGSANLAVYKLLRLNRFLYDIFLESHIWDHRISSLLSSGPTSIMENGNAYKEIDNKSLKERSPEGAEVSVFKDVHIEESRHQDEDSDSSPIPINNEISISCSEDNLPSTSLQVDIPQKGTNDLSVSQINSLESSPSYVCDMKGWFWASFLEIQKEHIFDLQRGHLPKFEPFSSHSIKNIPKAQELINEEGSRMHIPLGSDEYMISDFEDEFSSIIACCLTLLNSAEVNFDTRNEKAVSTTKTSESSQNLGRMLSAPQYWSSSINSDSEGIRSALSLEEARFSSFDGLNLLDSLVSLPSVHPEVHMGVRKSPGKAKYSVQCVYAHQFRDLRNYCCPSELHYIASLGRCRNWDAKGGKSKSFFAKTLDDRFIIKEIKRTEFESFWKFAPDYFKYMKDCVELGNQTCLAKILGVYQVTIRQNKSGKETKHDLMVMENISFGRNVYRQYDLKGALHARLSSNDGSGDDVLLDQNFVNDMNTSPLYVSRTSKRFLQRAVWNDTSFLNSINVMDYSLLVGVDMQSHELVVGIIDYLRQYTWDKQLENWVKSSLVVPKNQLPTVISPKEYKKRFRKFITDHFLSVPDHWCSETHSNPCKLCWTEEEEDHNLDPKSSIEIPL